MSNDGMTIKPLVAVAGPTPAANAGAKQGASPQPAAEAPAPVLHAKSKRTPSESIEAVAQQLETYLRRVSRSLEFHVDATSGRTVCSVRDGETGDLIRQIPNEEVLRLAELAQDETIVLVSERV
jgi:flagellar protein FlaG